LYSLSGLSFKNVEIQSKLGKKKLPTILGDILFSHKAITGPAIFKVSALSAFDNIEELEITIKLVDISEEKFEKYIKENQKKTIKNVFSKFAPESYINTIIGKYKIDGNKQTAQIKKQEKEILINSLLALKLHATSRLKDSEIVTAGGVDLKEIDSKTMQSKLVKGLYFAGEVLNIDAYTGGFNLQNCWSTAYIVSLNI
jgi:predicted Rossmann fold flavoprotein